MTSSSTPGVLSPAELEEALIAQRAVSGSRRRLGQVVVDLRLATERQTAEALAGQLGPTWVDLNSRVLAPDVVRQLPRGVAFRLGALLLSRDGAMLTVAVSDPTDVVALDDVRLHTRDGELVVVVATESQITAHLTRREVLVREPTESRVAAAVTQVTSLREAAVRLALTGGTPFDEVARVSPPD